MRVASYLSLVKTHCQYCETNKMGAYLLSCFEEQNLIHFPLSSKKMLSYQGEAISDCLSVMQIQTIRLS